jgi:TolB-like protein/Tfp pilus assembly protein PilF
MASVWAELRRRNVFRVAAAYAVVGWLIIQVVSALSAPLNLPEWFEAVTVTLLAIGFPIALLFAWAFDLTPDGIRLTQRDDAATKESGGNKLDYALIGGLLVVAAVTLWGQLPTASVNDLTQPSAVEEAPSIAVLPFADMSPDGDQEYFGDGIAEELLNELVRLEGLRVASRTSSFSFKNSGSDVLAIAETLNVNSILEGSVRKDGDRVRITAQLIDAADGFHLWSDTYDRYLTDIFAVQEEIATAVAGALGVTLGVGGVNAFHGAGTQDIEAYETYLQGLSLTVPAAQRIAALERAIQLDPNYAAAWAALGIEIGGRMMWSSLPDEAPGLIEEGSDLIQRALELDPESARANNMQGTLRYARREWIEAQEDFAKALTLRTDRGTLRNVANMMLRAGRSTAALSQYDAAEAAEPLDGRPDAFRLHASLAKGRIEEAKELHAWAQNGIRRVEDSVHIAINEDDPEALRSALAALPSSLVSTTALYSPVLDVFNSSEMVLSVLRDIFADESMQWPSKLHDIALLAAYFGDPEFALRLKGREVRNTSIRLFAVWYPVMLEVRQLPEFKELVTDINLVDYWRVYGWADACRPLGDDDFTCS